MWLVGRILTEEYMQSTHFNERERILLRKVVKSFMGWSLLRRIDHYFSYATKIDKWAIRSVQLLTMASITDDLID